MSKLTKFMAKNRKVKPVSRVSRFEKLRAMECFDLVYERIRQGWPISELARFIQEDKKEYQSLSRSGLVQVLTDFRKSIPAAELVEARMPAEFIEAKKTVEAALDEVAELESLYRLQMTRVNMDFATEKKINKLLPSMTSEIREARSILESIATLKMETGLKPRAATRHEVDVEVDDRLGGDLAQKYGSAAAQKVIESAESRRKVSGIVERFLKLSSGAALDTEEVANE